MGAIDADYFPINCVLDYHLDMFCRVSSKRTFLLKSLGTSVHQWARGEGEARDWSHFGTAEDDRREETRSV
jgi:hypothetical protein